MPTGWMLGYAIGAVVVVVVAVLVVTAIVLANRVVRQAGDIAAALVEAREHTQGLWEVATINRHLESIAESATILRRLAGGDPT
ncbi:MAG TPA: hypothetical protein ENK55_09895 [Actinobacteria bacterium]|nr:hypothetical protein [Actinomycetota bacterium]